MVANSTVILVKKTASFAERCDVAVSICTSFARRRIENDGLAVGANWVFFGGFLKVFFGYFFCVVKFVSLKFSHCLSNSNLARILPSVLLKMFFAFCLLRMRYTTSRRRYTCVVSLSGRYRPYRLPVSPTPKPNSDSTPPLPTSDHTTAGS